MMLRRFGSVLALAAACLVAACKTTPEGDGSVITDGPDQRPRIEPRDDLAKVPVSLWSPAQRRAAAGYYFLVAETMAMRQETKRALPVFETAYGLDPNPFLGAKMLAAKAASGEGAEALLEARKMVLLYPRDPQLRLLYGDLLAKTGALADAAEQLEKCIELDPSLEQAYIELTEVYQQSKQPAKALVVAKELVKHAPGSILGWSVLARLYIVQGQPKEALIPARRAWEMQSGNPHLAQVYAIVLQMTGNTKQALRIYEQLYRMDPTDDELTSRMVELYRQIGNLDDALALLDEMAKEEGAAGSGRPAVQMQKALLLWELKRFKEASDLLSKLAAEHPESDRLRYLSAVGLERIERLDDALVAYRSVPDSSQFRHQADFRIVVVLKQQKRYDEALVVARQMLQSNQADIDSFVVVASVYGDAGRFDDAIKVIEEGIARFPEKGRLTFTKGVYQEKAGDRDGCIESMRAVIKLDPGNAGAYNYLGYLFAEAGENLDEAETLITRALELKPNDGFYLDSLGWVHYQRGDYDKALPILEKALKIEPQEGVIMEHIGDVLLKKGDRKGAATRFRQALETQLDPKDRERIQKKAKELGG